MRSWKRSLTLLTVLALVVAPAASPPVSSAVRRCQGFRLTHVGTSGPDTIVGTLQRDVIATGRGGDTVIAAQGGDIVCTGRGHDFIHGGEGYDSVRGGRGNDTCLDTERRRSCKSNPGQRRSL